MFLQHLKLTKVRHSAVVGLVCLICVLSSATGTVSQTPTPTATQVPNEIKIGVRDDVPAIGQHHRASDSFTGFCKVFSDELQKELKTINPNTEVKLDIIINGPNTGTDRYDSLTLPNTDYKKDMQCGPNSKQYEYNTNKIIFSEPFYTTKIKLILKKNDIDNLNKNFKDRSNDIAMYIKKNIKIGVVEGTTTFDNLKSNQYSIISYKTRSQALEALLKKGDVQALASDGIILRYLLSLSILPNQEYDIFNKGLDALDTNEEKYAIAISKMGNTSQYYQVLHKATNKVLSQNKLQQESKKLSNYENDINPFFPEILVDKWVCFGVPIFMVFVILLVRIPRIRNQLKQWIRDLLNALPIINSLITNVNSIIQGISNLFNPNRPNKP